MVTNNSINVGTGLAGQVLTSNGAGVAPTFQALPASGITGTVDEYEVVVGATANTVTSVGPGTAGQALLSGGASANPAYSTNTYPNTSASGSILYATGTNAIGNLAPSTRYGAPVGSDGTNPVYLDKNQYVYVFDDWICGGGSTASALGWSTGQSGGSMSSNPNATVTSTNPGIMRATTGGTSSGWVNYRLGSNATDTGPIKFGGGYISHQWIIGLSALSDGTDTYTVYVGMGGGTDGSEMTDGAYFAYTHGTNSGNWVFKTANGGSRTTGNSSNAATTSFQRLRIDVNAAATSVSFFFNDVECANSPLAADIPTNSMNIFFSIIKSAGANARMAYLDLMTFYQKLTVSR